MLIDTTFFCGLDQISLPIMQRKGKIFHEDYFITTDSGEIFELVHKFSDHIGSLEFGYLVSKAKAVVYRKSKLDLDGEHQVSKALADQLVDDMLAVKVLDSALWSIRDNACHFDRAWIVGMLSEQIIINNNVWSSRHTCADGSHDVVAFSFDELRVARRSGRPRGIYLKGDDAPTALSKGSLRFQRFEYFIGAARASIDVAFKIAQYCSGLEALVSTSQQELSHQVSERVSAVLVGPGPKRIAVFKLVKKAYGYRSKTVHGASFDAKDAEQLRECSRNVDQLCRALQALYFDDDPSFRTAVESSDHKKSTDFFIEAVLGARGTRDRLTIDLA